VVSVGMCEKRHNMTLTRFLKEKKPAMIKKWFDLVVDTYPTETRRFLRKEKDQFGNPVGSTISHEMEILYEELLGEGDEKRIVSSLDNIIRIRAIQDFSPSEAVGFVLGLKGLIRDESKNLAAGQPEGDLSEELHAIEKRIDDALLIAFDIYSKCREKIHNLRANESKRQVSRLLQKANMLVEISDEEPGGQDKK
jgi:hypothetical protein